MKKQTKIANSIINELKKTCPGLIKKNKDTFKPMKNIPKRCRKLNAELNKVLKQTKKWKK